MKITAAKAAAWLVVLAGLAVAVAPLFRHGDLAIPMHHVFHAVSIAGGAALGLLLIQNRKSDDREHPLWLVPAIAAPIVMMFLMWPSLYEALEVNPALHVGDHLVLFFIGTIAVVSGQRYRAGTGWALGALSVIMALTSAGGFGAYL